MITFTGSVTTYVHGQYPSKATEIRCLLSKQLSLILWVEGLQQADRPCKATYGESNKLITSKLTIRRL
jgi:hypothetical protein